MWIHVGSLREVHYCSSAFIEFKACDGGWKQQYIYAADPGSTLGTCEPVNS